MADAAIFQVIDLIADVLRAHAPLADYTVMTDVVDDEATESTKAIVITALGVQTDVPPEQWNTSHRATIEFGVIDDKDTPGIITRNNMAAIGHIIAAIAQDRTFGGLIDDIQELDVAGTSSNGRDVASASLQARVEFTTSRGDWFTLVN